MSTDIRGRFGDERHVVLNHRGDIVFIALPHATAEWKDSAVKRADFLKAVADELDVIVVERSELPEVQPRDPKRGYNVGAVRMLDGSDYDAAECRATGLRWLALAEHLDANPPVDEAEVKRVVRAFIEAGAFLEGAEFTDLVRAGIRAPEVTP